VGRRAGVEQDEQQHLKQQDLAAKDTGVDVGSNANNRGAGDRVSDAVVRLRALALEAQKEIDRSVCVCLSSVNSV
jgi:hypothetical protein